MYGRVKLLQHVEHPEDPAYKKALKVIGSHQLHQPAPWAQMKVIQDFKAELKTTHELGRGLDQCIEKTGKNSHTSYCGILDFVPGVNLAGFIIKNPLTGINKHLEIFIKCCQEV